MAQQPPLIYTLDPYDNHPWRQALREIYEDGVRGVSYLCPLTVAWREDGSFDFTLLDELTDEIFALAPEAQLLSRVFLATPDWWDALHEEELLKFDGPAPRVAAFHTTDHPFWQYENKMYHSVRNPSVASRLWQHDAAEALRNYTAHLLKRYGRNHVYGIQPAYGTCGEWGLFGSYTNGQFGNGDFSRPMVDAFRKFLITRYGDRPEFHDALPPSKVERMRTENGILRSPAFFQRVLDYYDCLAEEQLNAVRCFCRAVKAVDPSLQTGSFGLYLMNTGSSAYQLHQLPMAAQKLRLAEMPELDFVSTPNGYQERKRGLYLQMPEHSAARRKLLIAECDVRTEWATDRFAPSREDCPDQFLFEVGYNLSVGSGCFWLYDFGRHWFRDPEIRALIRPLARYYARPRKMPAQAEIAVVTDPASVCCTEGSVGYYRSFLRFLCGDLPRCGTVFDTITMDDFFSEPAYKLYIFRDKFLSTPEESRRIRSFLEKHQASAVWFGPAGTVQPERIDFSGSRLLTGFELRPLPGVTGSNAVTMYGHPLLEGMETPFALAPVEDSEAVYAPVLTGSGGEVLGLVESTGLPGCLLKQEEKRFDLWCSFPVLPKELLHSLLKKIGIRFRIDGAAVCYGAGETLVVRADCDGPVAVLVSGPGLRNIITDETLCAENGRVVIPMRKGQTVLLEILP